MLTNKSSFHSELNLITKSYENDRKKPNQSRNTGLTENYTEPTSNKKYINSRKKLKRDQISEQSEMKKQIEKCLANDQTILNLKMNHNRKKLQLKCCKHK